MTDLSKPCIDDTQVVVMVRGSLGHFLNPSLQSIFLALVVIHLTPNGVLLKILHRQAWALVSEDMQDTDLPRQPVGSSS